MRRRTTRRNAKAARKIGTPALKRFIVSEARRLQRENLGDEPQPVEDVEAQEYLPGEEADQLEKDLDHMKALKIEEARLVKRLKRLREVKKVVKKRMVRSL